MNDREWLLQQREDIHAILEGTKSPEEILSRVLRDLKILEEAKHPSFDHPLLSWNPADNHLPEV